MLDKGKAASVAIIVETKDKATGQVVFENQSTLFIRGSGGFGGKRTGKGNVKLVLGAWELTLSNVYGQTAVLPPPQTRRRSAARML